MKTIRVLALALLVLCLALVFAACEFDGTPPSAGTVADETTNTYTVTYILNGGTNAAGNPATYTIVDDFALHEPTWECGAFLGWYDAGGTKVTNLLGHYGDLTLTARWECYFTVSESGAITGVSDYFRQNVTALAIPTSLNGVEITAVGDYAFYGCPKLTSVTIPNSVTSIRGYAFYGCSGLTSITIPDGVTSIGYGAFYNCSGLTSITIPDSVTSIEDYAFRNCSSLTSVTIGNGVTSIGSYAFRYCSGLTSVTWNAANCTPAGSNTLSIFSDCSDLTTVTFGNNVTTIPAYAFYECTGLTSITIPDSVTSIGNSAFYGCVKLIEVRNLSALNITAGSTGNGYVGYRAKRVYTDGESYLHCVDDYLFYDDGTGVYLAAYLGTDTELTLPDDYNGKNYSINQCAFDNCSKLTSIAIPDGVTDIENWAFWGCSKLTSVTIGDSVTRIGYAAFYNCSSLTSITIGNGVKSIEGDAFESCSKLTSITFTGTKAQWNAISKRSDWIQSTGNYTVHCTDGDIAK